MEMKDRTRYEALMRIRAFGQAHQAEFPESTVGGQAFARVAHAIAQIEAHSLAQSVAARDGRTAKSAARLALRTAMRAVAKTARGLALSVRGGADVLRMPTRRSETEWLRAAHRFLEQAAPVADELVRLGLPPTFVADLRAATDRFHDTLEGRRTGRRQVAEARAGIRAALSDASQAVRQLEIVVPNVLKAHPDLLAGWRRDRQLVRGPRRSQPAATADTTEATQKGGGETVMPDGPADSLSKAS